MTVAKSNNYGIPIGPNADGGHLWEWYAIEDHEDGRPARDHFFHDDRKARYRLWHGGSGSGHADTLDEARRELWGQACASTDRRIASLRRQLAESEQSRSLLGDDPAYLERFSVPLDWTPKQAEVPRRHPWRCRLAPVTGPKYKVGDKLYRVNDGSTWPGVISIKPFPVNFVERFPGGWFYSAIPKFGGSSVRESELFPTPGDAADALRARVQSRINDMTHAVAVAIEGLVTLRAD